ncbi:putative fyve phd zinc finger [Erysiphe neolycopersici]|uniref:Putative fyve phd zinc finger n=1 Tax=Erysiphe neolycopersici TaxID=212602 RepID=A0A420HSI4_9PEZI|nr:putative fyve phd zinc finger [Erysiphe neolycopersici]
MDTARRSLRAFRASQPQSISNQTTNSSSRADRTTRSTIKLDSPEKLIILGSLSTLKSEGSIFLTEDAPTMQTRRKRGRAEEQRDKPLRIQASQVHNPSRLDQVGEDDEVVRCICGLDDYPGLPKSEGEVNSETHELIEDPLNSISDVAEDAAGFFLQCDICKVWQHGGCVGIKNEGSSPEEYFCERCRKDLHKIFTATNGQQYSHYLPLHQSLPCSTPCTGSLPPKEEAQSPKSNKTTRPQNLHHANAKRRSTMNSRDAAYDEEEQVQRAIVASKDVSTVENVDGCMRRGKRGRSESEEKLQGSKRQRTKSASSSSSQEFNQISPQQESDDGVNGRTTSCKKTRSTTGSKTPQEKDLKDFREKSRCDATAKRNGRAERRRVDDQETQKEVPLGSRNIVGLGIDSSNNSTLIESLESSTISNGRVSDNPPTNQLPLSSKKSNRNLNSRKGKLVKNHFTRERDQQVHDDQHSYRSQSRDALRTDDTSQTYPNGGFSSEPRTSKFKGNPSKVTMTDMKRRISAILDFISRTQLEMASESIYYATEDSVRNKAQRQTDAPQASQVECDLEGRINVLNHATEISHSPKEFKDLSCRDMMDILTKQLIKWQKDFLH